LAGPIARKILEAYFNLDEKPKTVVVPTTNHNSTNQPATPTSQPVVPTPTTPGVLPVESTQPKLGDPKTTMAPTQ